MQNGALSVGMYMDESAYLRLRTTPASGAYYLGAKIGENHGVAVVGWDDAVRQRATSAPSTG